MGDHQMWEKKLSITTAQIRGARGILNWSQQDLAQRTGISATSIGSIENGQTTPRHNTLETIRKSFETSGIEFIGMDGVRLRTGGIRVYKGKEGFIEFYDDVYEVVKSIKNDVVDVLASNVDERLFVKTLGEYAPVHVSRIKALGNVHYRILVKDGDNYAPGSDYAEYRWIPKELFASVPFYVYGEKLSIITFDGEPAIIVLHYPAIANAYRVQFEDMWQRGTTVEGDKVIRSLETE